ncbi:hypothetical protein WJX82_010471 [Trebouxia sp. C0006]
MQQTFVNSSAGIAAPEMGDRRGACRIILNHAAFPITAAWLMQVRVCKIGYPRTGLWFKRGSLVDASLSVQEWRM